MAISVVDVVGLHVVGVPACVIDDRQRVVTWNQDASDFFGLAPEQALGREWHSVVRSLLTPGCCALCKTRRALGEGLVARPVTSTLLVPGGERRAILVPLPLEADTGKALAFLIITAEVGTAARAQYMDERVISELTAREREVMQCIARGLDARTIGRSLGISYSTVRNHVQNVLRKLDAHSKAEAVAYAFQHDLIEICRPA